MEKKSRILIIGVTGNLGFELAKASLNASHPTFALVRDFSNPNKSHKLHTLSDAGATLLKGSLQDEDSLVAAINQVDVVICAVSSKQVLDQKLLINSIKHAPHIKRFIPSEFGLDPDKTQISEFDHGFYSRKADIRQLVEARGIPYTYVSCNFYTSYLLPSLVQPGLKTPPRDKFMVFGDGNIKGVFVKESDVATFTISTVDDPRTLNKVLYLRPPGNVYSMTDLVEIWESKIKKKLEKIYISEEELLKKIRAWLFKDRVLGLDVAMLSTWLHKDTLLLSVAMVFNLGMFLFFEGVHISINTENRVVGVNEAAKEETVPAHDVQTTASIRRGLSITVMLPLGRKDFMNS